MNTATIRIQKFNPRENGIEALSEQMDKFPKYGIDFEPWEADFTGKAEFAIAYANDSLFLKYYVVEEHVRAVFINTKDPVYKDSCVEFFISFNNKAEYYNLEFNCTGTCLAGYGKNKDHREFLENESVEQIKSLTKFKNMIYNNKPMISWELTLMLPIEIFDFDDIETMEGESVKVNFFKCGDDLPNPHYLCWSEIKSEEPNFHQSEFFGQAIFA